MRIWRASGASKLEISVQLHSGAGWYTLSAKEPDGTQSNLSRIDNDGVADGDAMFQVSVDDSGLVCLLQVKCAVTQGGDAKVMLEVRQNGQILRCHNASQKALNGGQAPYKALELGTVAAKTAKTFDFEIWT
jgi:hypothetical protein